MVLKVTNITYIPIPFRKRGEADGESPSQSPMKFVEDESLPGEPPKRRRPTAPVVRRHKAAKRSSAVDAAPIQDENLLREVTDSTVNAVKALLAATKQERTKRGKYVKYTNEMKDEIAEYAIKNGHVEAAKVYGEKLGCVISESTIRNFVRAYNQCAPMLKEEVGRHAYQYGIESCLKAFEGKLGVEINRKIVRRYKQVNSSEKILRIMFRCVLLYDHVSVSSISWTRILG